MLKRMFMVLAFVLVSFGVASANPQYRPYLNGDRNYIMCTMHQDAFYYVERDSLRVDSYNPPEYVITVNIATVDSGGRNISVSHSKPVHFYYNYENGEMYVNTKDYFKNANDEWKYLEPKAGWSRGGRFVVAGDIAFYLAYGMGFYIDTDRLSERVDS